VERKLGIEEKDKIWVESAVGRIKVVAKLYEGASPDVVGVPLGFGHRGMGRWAKGIGENPRRIEESDLKINEMPRARMTRVKVYKA
jgi:anaerobic selenocysteine-containing dehydrogenase